MNTVQNGQPTADRTHIDFSGSDTPATTPKKRGRKSADPKPLLGFDVTLTFADGSEGIVSVFASDLGEACKIAGKVSVSGATLNGGKKLPSEG